MWFCLLESQSPLIESHCDQVLSESYLKPDPIWTCRSASQLVLSIAEPQRSFLFMFPFCEHSYKPLSFLCTSHSHFLLEEMSRLHSKLWRLSVDPDHYQNHESWGIIRFSLGGKEVSVQCILCSPLPITVCNNLCCDINVLLHPKWILIWSGNGAHSELHRLSNQLLYF